MRPDDTKEKEEGMGEPRKENGRKGGRGKDISNAHAEDLLVDDGGDGEAVETICECLPQFDVVSALAYKKSRTNKYPA